jgi:apolipoprotein N-acyltransferase
MKQFIPYLAPLASGILLFLSFPPYGLTPLVWIALVPLMIAIRGRGPKRSFLFGLLTGTVYMGGTMPWIYYVSAVYGNIWPPIALLLTIILMLFLGLYVGIYAWAVTFFEQGGFRESALLISPFLIVALEYGREHILTGLPWALLAHTQAFYPSMVQIAAYTGVEGVTFLIVAVNASIAITILRFKQGERGKKLFLLPSAVISLVLINAVWGYYHAAAVDNSEGVRIKTAIIQGNIPQTEKWDRKYRNKIITSYFKLTAQEADKGAKLIVWPEAAIPFYFERDIQETKALLKLSKIKDATIVFGGMGAERTAGKKGYSYINRGFAVEKGRLAGKYDKIHLVPFGEYVPFRKLLFFVNTLTDAVSGDIVTGDSTKPILLSINGEDIPAGIQICFEIIFAKGVRDFAKNGARLILNLTNDSWYGQSGASMQHMAAIPFRAVENRLPVVRAANTGISGFISASGRVSQPTAMYETLTISEEILVPTGAATFYTRYGEIFTYMCILLLIPAYLFARKEFQAR